LKRRTSFPAFAGLGLVRRGVAALRFDGALSENKSAIRVAPEAMSAFKPAFEGEGRDKVEGKVEGKGGW
jgi:hypothetical protein